MKLAEFREISKEIIELRALEKSIDPNVLILNDEVQLIIEGRYCYLTQGQYCFSVEPVVNKVATVQQIQRAKSNWILIKFKKDHFLLSAIETQGDDIQISIDIGVSDYFVQQLFEEKKIPESRTNLALTWLKEEFLVEKTNAESLLFAAIYSNNPANSLDICGRDYIATLNRINNVWSIARLTHTKRANIAFRRLIGSIEFTDASVAAKLKSSTHQQALNDAINSHGGYIQLWQKYSDVEWELAIESARHLSFLTLNRYEKHPGKMRHWYFYAEDYAIDNFKEKWISLSESQKDKTIQVASFQPDWLSDQKELRNTGLSVDARPWLGDVIKIEKDRVLVKIQSDRDRKPPSRLGCAYLFLAVNGNMKVRQRREYAVDKIKHSMNPMPQLHALLEGISTPFERKRPLEPLSPAARGYFENGNPTDRQKEALKIALNTPDIAIIIGPPGTGKTKVITALQQRLAEELGDLPLQHQMLATSFQHDAVDNVLLKTKVLGLFGIKIGERSYKGASESIDPVDKWCQEKKSHLEQLIIAKTAAHPALSLVKTLKEQLMTLRLGCENTQRRQVMIAGIDQTLIQLSKSHQITLRPQTAEQWRQLKPSEDHIPAQSTSRARILRHIRALRTTVSGFNDDGARRCLDLIVRLEQAHTPLYGQELQLLEELALLSVTSVLPTERQLQQLAVLKDKLLDQFIPDFRPITLQKVVSEADCILFDAMINEINMLVKSSKTLGYLMVLDEYLSALKYSPDTLKKAAQDYVAVLGATCQQSASNLMSNIKSLNDTQNIIFNTVIVDEAARANPLDLMIPMSMGKERIILVGDHRQLPHLLEPKVEEQLAAQVEFETTQKEMLKESLFQRLVKNLNEIGKEPNQPKRVVMLDTQFRMHRVLGEFVSQQFYVAHNLPAVKTGRKDEDFIHNVPDYENLVCGWIDVPVKEGRSKPVDGSLGRVVEAQKIAQEAKRILNACPNLSVGVISFYRGQVDLILESLVDQGIAERVDGDINIKTEYRALASGGTRLRVGSVDAFQGLEFDVVLLSLVRTGMPDIDPDNDDSLTRAYGFLRLDNRLNVAMSRQHRLLIVVGEYAFAKHVATAKAVPALAAFAELCEGVYGIVC